MSFIKVILKVISPFLSVFSLNVDDKAKGKTKPGKMIIETLQAEHFKENV